MESLGVELDTLVVVVDASLAFSKAKMFNLIIKPIIRGLVIFKIKGKKILLASCSQRSRPMCSW